MTSATYQTTTLSSVHPWLKRNETSLDSCPKVVSYTHDSGSGPVLFLIHGYPQSAFIWRHVAPLLKDKISLFIPEIPGYGISSAPKEKIQFSTVGKPLVEVCGKLFPGRDVIFGGHDRGARICHRLAVDNAHAPEPPKAKLLGCIMLDIVPTQHAWKGFANPRAAVSYWHWPFLASPLAVPMMQAFGGGKLTRTGLDRLAGSNTASREKFQADGAWQVYTSLFDTDEAIEGSCADYNAGAFVEPDLQEEDQKAGRHIEVPTLVSWSARNLGAMHSGKVEEIWKPWVKPGVKLTAVPCGDDVGHYLPEEASEKIAGEITKFLDEIL
ncbi:alpha/beta hydrolase fold-containing protein 22 [Elsinoe australis]|uniref:Alpha/beta hydrolase fold-containing protein 22 n=1 Tax=Elsinoe australis TaxID=40998 RepID=A0A4U7B1X9_9PEZI|nr:alpha/beta hydrolase fold-containing protein 22 [Elsinoe australis]